MIRKNDRVVTSDGFHGYVMELIREDYAIIFLDENSSLLTARGCSTEYLELE